MIVITGATGALNGATVEHLLTLVPADQIGVSVRDVAKAQHFADRGVRVRRGAYDDPAALRDSFEGADQVLVVSSNDPAADAVALNRAAVEAAVDSGAGRILYTSHQNARAETPFKPGRDHQATEEILAKTGVAWTSLRNGFYAHSLEWMLGPWQETGVIATPADGPVSWTDRADEAVAAAVILAAQYSPDTTQYSPGAAQYSPGAAQPSPSRAQDNPGGGRSFDGAVTLTASQAVTFDDVAAIASELTGREIKREVMDDEDWVAAQVAHGSPEFMARFLLGFFQSARAGHFADIDPTLAELLGHEPRSVTDLLTERVNA